MQDLRVSIGTFFLILGGVLAATPASGTMLAVGPVNFYTGAASLVFGAVMVALSRRRRPR